MMFLGPPPTFDLVVLRGDRTAVLRTGDGATCGITTMIGFSQQGAPGTMVQGLSALDNKLHEKKKRLEQVDPTSLDLDENPLLFIRGWNYQKCLANEETSSNYYSSIIYKNQLLYYNIDILHNFSTVYLPKPR
ncbi:PREDICTED: uncharacterized protein LOC107072754 [Polistes dominula]|uniref:Uncharacterized protein LOC107072754 n=1 Tax=Polistes dominula TaxID=743375 RepID=A0ABM1J7I2_POLDO|nr:PREDICTED: uncharacterized protein LOC107072754 [Polistes dominula]